MVIFGLSQERSTLIFSASPPPELLSVTPRSAVSLGSRFPLSLSSFVTENPSAEIIGAKAVKEIVSSHVSPED